MSAKEFHKKAFKKIDELEDLYAKKSLEVYDQEVTLFEREGAKYIEDLEAGDAELADKLLDFLSEVAVNLELKGVRERLDSVEGRVADWAGRGGEAFYDYLAKAQTATDNQVELVHILTALQEAHRDVIVQSREDAITILDQAIEEMEKVTTETEVDEVDLTIAVVGGVLNVVGSSLGGGGSPAGKAGSVVGIAGDVVGAVGDVKNSFKPVLKGGDPKAIYDSVPAALKTLKKSTKTEVEAIEAGLKTLAELVEKYWDYYVPPPPNLQVPEPKCVPSRQSLAA